MSVEFDFIDNAEEIKKFLEESVGTALEAAGLAAEGYAKGNCDQFTHPTGALRNSITHEVDTADRSVMIGTAMEYAVYVEMGTGIYTSEGGGRNTPWAYEDERGEWHITRGQKPKPYLKPAVADHIDEYHDIIEKYLKEE